MKNQKQPKTIMIDGKWYQLIPLKKPGIKSEAWSISGKKIKPKGELDGGVMTERSFFVIN